MLFNKKVLYWLGKPYQKILILSDQSLWVDVCKGQREGEGFGMLFNWEQNEKYIQILFLSKHFTF